MRDEMSELKEIVYRMKSKNREQSLGGHRVRRYQRNILSH